jgi:hypothetical protein
MKNQIKLILMILLSLNLYGQNLTKQQLDKLHSPVVKTLGSSFIIEEFNQINFNQKVFFDGQNTNTIFVKTYATLNSDRIHKEQFIALSSSLSDSIMQSIFMNPQYFNYMSSMELLTSKPKNVNLTIELRFTKDGINTSIQSTQHKQNKFIPYTELFFQKMQF